MSEENEAPEYSEDELKLMEKMYGDNEDVRAIGVAEDVRYFLTTNGGKFFRTLAERAVEEGMVALLESYGVNDEAGCRDAHLATEVGRQILEWLNMIEEVAKEAQQNLEEEERSH